MLRNMNHVEESDTDYLKMEEQVNDVICCWLVKGQLTLGTIK